MRINTIASALIMISTGAILSSCNSSAEKLENAEQNVKEASLELNEAHREFLADIEKFKKEVAARIAANQEQIDDFKEKISNENKAAKAIYKEKIAVLEKRNSALEEKMEAYDEDGEEKWAKFKAEFNSDMDELGKAFAGLFKK